MRSLERCVAQTTFSLSSSISLSLCMSVSPFLSPSLPVSLSLVVLLLAQRVELGDGVVEGLLCQLARLGGLAQDLKVEDGEVEGQAEADGVRGGEAVRGHLGRLAVLHDRLFTHRRALLVVGDLGDVPLRGGGGRCGGAQACENELNSCRTYVY